MHKLEEDKPKQGVFLVDYQLNKCWVILYNFRHNFHNIALNHRCNLNKTNVGNTRKQISHIYCTFIFLVNNSNLLQQTMTQNNGKVKDVIFHRCN